MISGSSEQEQGGGGGKRLDLRGSSVFREVFFVEPREIVVEGISHDAKSPNLAGPPAGAAVSHRAWRYRATEQAHMPARGFAEGGGVGDCKA
ncbi:unnamed protein product [Urochloa humidicola]